MVQFCSWLMQCQPKVNNRQASIFCSLCNVVFIVINKLFKMFYIIDYDNIDKIEWGLWSPKGRTHIKQLVVLKCIDVCSVL